MKTTRGLISIFALPQEIDDLHITLFNLKRNVAMLPRDIVIDIDLTLCLSDELTDWEASKLPKEYFLAKFESILPLIDWSPNPKIQIEYSNTILGCVSHRRHSLLYVNDYHFTIWLDCDLFFADPTLLWMVTAFNAAREENHSNFIITPQFVRQWDTSWDVLVNEHFIHNKLMYHEEADIIDDIVSHTYANLDMSLLPIADTQDETKFKFAGGWFTLISNDLLKIVGIPTALGHYGLEDTFIAHAATFLSGNSKNGVVPKQFILNNVVVGENYKHRCNSHLQSFVASKNRKKEFHSIAQQNFYPELVKFTKKHNV